MRVHADGVAVMILARCDAFARKAVMCTGTSLRGAAVRGSFALLGLAFVFVSVCALAFAPTSAVAATSQSIALLNCALLDDNAEYDAELTRAQLARAAMISDTLRAQLHERALYRVADNAPA